MQPSHQFGGSLGIGGEGFVAEMVFPSIGYRAAFDQIHEGIGKEVGMHAEVAFAGQMSTQRLEEGAGVKGDATAVFHDGGDIGGDPVDDIIDRPARKVDRRFSRPYQIIEIIHMDEGVSHRSREQDC